MSMKVVNLLFFKIVELPRRGRLLVAYVSVLLTSSLVLDSCASVFLPL